MREELMLKLENVTNILKNASKRDNDQRGYYIAALKIKEVLKSIQDQRTQDNEEDLTDFVLKFELLLLKSQFKINSIIWEQADLKFTELENRFKRLKLSRDNLKIATDIMEMKNNIDETKKSKDKVAYNDYRYNYANNVYEYLKLDDIDEAEDSDSMEDVYDMDDMDALRKQYVKYFFSNKPMIDKLKLCNEAINLMKKVDKYKASYKPSEVVHCAIIHAGLLESRADILQVLAEAEDTVEKQVTYKLALEAYEDSIRHLKNNNQEINAYLLLSCASVIDTLMQLEGKNDRLGQFREYVNLTKDKRSELETDAQDELSGYQNKIASLSDSDPNNNNNNNNNSNKSKNAKRKDQSDDETSVGVVAYEEDRPRKKGKTEMPANKGTKVRMKNSSAARERGRLFSNLPGHERQTNRDKAGDIFVKQLTTFLNQVSLYLSPNVGKNKLYIEVIKFMALNHCKARIGKTELKKNEALSHLLLEVAFSLDPEDSTVKTLLFKLRERNGGKIALDDNIKNLIYPLNEVNVATLYITCLNNCYDDKSDKAKWMKDFIQQIAPAVSEVKLKLKDIENMTTITTFNNKDASCYSLSKLLQMNDENLLKTLRTFGDEFPREYDQYITAQNQSAASISNRTM